LEPAEKTGRSVGTGALLLGSEGETETELELESSPEGALCGRKDVERHSLTRGQSSRSASSNACSQGETKSARKGAGRTNSGLAVSWFSPGISVNAVHPPAGLYRTVSIEGRIPRPRLS